jgi:hypothetical protein
VALKELEGYDPNSKERNRFAASVLRPYFSVPSSGDIYIARRRIEKIQSAIQLVYV